MDNISIEQLYIKGRNLYTVTIELINECNWHCKHCYLDNNKMELPPSMVYEIIDNANTKKIARLRVYSQRYEVQIISRIRKEIFING